MGSTRNTCPVHVTHERVAAAAQRLYTTPGYGTDDSDSYEELNTKNKM